MTFGDTIGTALDKVATAVDQVADGRWSFAIVNGTTVAASARVDGAWLVLDAPLRAEAVSGREWAMLGWNAALDGGARFVLPPIAPAIHVRADVALEPDIDVGRRIIEAHASLAAAASRLHGTGAAATCAPTAAVAATPEDLPALCRETGWSVTERDAGQLVVDLDVPGALHQAVVARRVDGAVVTAVPVLDSILTDVAAASDTCRRAFALLLMRTCGSVRMVRASDVTSPRFEVVQTRPTVTELAHGLAALSIACRLAAAEAAVLWHDDAVAGLYLRHSDDVRRTHNQPGGV